jgi:hypothetical protein
VAESTAERQRMQAEVQQQLAALQLKYEQVEAQYQKQMQSVQVF